jgi:hypothetical protein
MRMHVHALLSRCLLHNYCDVTQGVLQCQRDARDGARATHACKLALT